jgi:tRNA (guanine-N7-)-methyltransferase
MDWSTHFPKFFPPASSDTSTTTPSPKVEFADVGCGFGGLLTALSPQFPDTLMLGMEIRMSVTAYVDARIKALRQIQGLLPSSAGGEMSKEAREAVKEAAGEDAPSVNVDTTTTATAAAAGEEPGVAAPDAEEAAEDRREQAENRRATREKVPGEFGNVSVIRANAMKHLPNFFEKGQVSQTCGGCERSERSEGTWRARAGVASVWMNRASV